MNSMEVSGVKVIFFDIGGVLLSNGWGHEARQKAAQAFSLDLRSINKRTYHKYA